LPPENTIYYILGFEHQSTRLAFYNGYNFNKYTTAFGGYLGHGSNGTATNGTGGAGAGGTLGLNGSES
jgi:hypothetical protein